MAPRTNNGGPNGSAPFNGPRVTERGPCLEYLAALRMSEVTERTTLSEAQIYKLKAALLFPQSIHLGGRSRGWLEHMIDAWLMSRMLARDRMATLLDPVTLPEWTLEMEEIVPSRIGIRLVRLPQVVARVGLKKSAIYDAIGRGAFPWPVPIGVHARAWVSHEIDEWLRKGIRRRQELDPHFHFLTHRAA